MDAQSLMGLASPTLRNWHTPNGAKASTQPVSWTYYANKKRMLTPYAELRFLRA